MNGILEIYSVAYLLINFANRRTAVMRRGDTVLIVCQGRAARQKITQDDVTRPPSSSGEKEADDWAAAHQIEDMIIAAARQ